MENPFSSKPKTPRRKRRFPIVRTSIAAAFTAIGAVAVVGALKGKKTPAS